jgi:hypothetical protein
VETTNWRGFSLLAFMSGVAAWVVVLLLPRAVL